MQELRGFGALAGRYDGFIIDLWGVIHDGVSPYEGAVACLHALRASGKPVVLLSNAPRRAAAAAQMLAEMGIGPTQYDAIVTSGEVTHAMLRDRHLPGADPWYAAIGRRVYHLGPERDRNLLDGLGLVSCAQPDVADFVLNTGPDDTRDPTDTAPFEPDLAAAAAHGLKMICANPDLEVIRGGKRIICAGALALRYRQLGGDMRMIGKPDPTIYGPVLEALGQPGAPMPAGRVLVVGDSLRTDIAGAAAIGADACWVLGGLHSNDPDPQTTAATAGFFPIAALRRFIW